MEFYDGLYHLPLLRETYPAPVVKAVNSFDPGMNDISRSWSSSYSSVSLEEGNQVGTTALRRPVCLLPLLERVNSQATKRFW